MLEVDQLSPDHWAKYSEQAHQACFNELKPREWDRIDFALVVRNGDTLMGYLTCREHDHETIYWQYGGSFPGTRDTALTYPGYLAFRDFCKSRYKRAITLIENTNLVMLKMALKAGFLVVGVRVFKGQILLEMLNEFEGA